MEARHAPRPMDGRLVTSTYKMIHSGARFVQAWKRIFSLSRISPVVPS